jgi:hypothetical protein
MFTGGITKCDNDIANAVYVGFFLLAFGGCFGGCFMNVFIQTTPSRNFAMDALTAYIHVPILCGLRFWRHVLYSEEDNHLHGLIRSLEQIADPTSRATTAAAMVNSICFASNLTVVALLAVVAVVDVGKRS